MRIPRPFGHPLGRGVTQDNIRRDQPLFLSEGVEMEHLSMRKIREVLRLRFEAGLSARQIAREPANGTQHRGRVRAALGCYAVDLAVARVAERHGAGAAIVSPRSEERRVGRGGRSRWAPEP